MGSHPDRQGIYAASLDSRDRKFIVATDSNAAYVESGQLLFTRGDVLMAQPFNLRSLTLTSEPRPVADHVELSTTAATGGVNAFASASFSVSPNGVLVWRRSLQSSQSQLQWFDRQGKKLSTVGEAADYSNPSLSPDNSKLAVCIRDPADQDARHLDLRSQARLQNAADLRSRR